MTRLEKCEMAISKGIKYDSVTGDIYGVRGNILKSKSRSGYIIINITYNKKDYNLYGHQFAWYIINKELVKCIDHINGIRYDNKISNLRSVTQQQNLFNNHKCKGYTYNKSRNKFVSSIILNKKTIHIGSYDNEIDARHAYLDAKKIYHI